MVVNGTIKLVTCKIGCCITMNVRPVLGFALLVGGVLTNGHLLGSPNEGIADPLRKHLPFGWSSPVQLLPRQ